MKKVLINDGWVFTLDSALDAYTMYGFPKYSAAENAAARYYENSNWEQVTLPHDWAIALGRDPKSNPFAGGYPKSRFHQYRTEEHTDDMPVGSVGWYRREFTPDPAWKGKRVFLEFEGIYRDAMLWVNGVYLERHASGYTPFTVEVTDHLVFGEINSIAVRVDADQREGWWYEGAGIYRNVWLHVGEPVYCKPYQTQAVGDMYGTVKARTVLVNDTASEVTKNVRFTMTDASSRICAAGQEDITLAPYAEGAVCAEITVSEPHLWDLSDPYLYTLHVQIDAEESDVRFGFRSVAMDPDRGFLLNGKPCKIRGACCHQDFGGVGIALNDNLHRYRIARLKEMGVNAYRSAHHAPAPALLDACDELGMLVMDETRTFGTSPEGLRQLKALVERDRSHPCVFIWSIGNEEFSVQDLPWSRRLAEKVSRILRTMDDTRPIIFGANNGENDTGLNPVMEVRGINYIRNGKPGWIERYHAKYPNQPILGTEESSYVLSRCGTENDLARGLLDSTGNVTMPWGSTPKGWVKFSEERDYFAGSFMWTGFDYRGEPNPFYYTNTESSFGTIDLCGMEKPPFYYYRAWWTDQPVLNVSPHWNFREGETAKISVFTNCEKITLFVNGRKVAEADVERFDAPLFEIPFEPGELTVKGEKDGETLTASLRTAGAADTIVCAPVLTGESERDVSIWEISALDKDGVLCRTADCAVTVRAENGTVLGVGNGDPASVDPEQLPMREISRQIRTFIRDGKSVPVPDKAGNTLLFRADWLETEPAKEGFEDDFRIIARYADHTDEPQEVCLTACVSDAEDFTFIEFERLGGKAEVYLNGEKIGDNFPRWSTYTSNVRPYRFACRFQPGENEVRVVCKRRATDAAPISGSVKIGKFVAPSYRIRLHGGLARVFLRGEDPQRITVSAVLTEE